MAEETEERNGQEIVGREGPPVVTIPGAGRAGNFPPPLKLETEESAEGVNPSNMWQVYALGGFMILRWIWARWRERKDKGGSVGGNPSAD
ncbi:uncharacterized protein LOC116264673 [Nymphaea colorata]|uniref:uncharacterized protein LOC116264673 n=1 Tax=Nymphaea colorata TaxID=210225 RepID=UPI00129D58F7|nr:uncharacterized protein LOC116264673 [Nymphaea colorata]